MLEDYTPFRSERGSDVYISVGLPVHYICKACRDEGRGDYKLSKQGMLHICTSCKEEYEIIAVPKIKPKRVM